MPSKRKISFISLLGLAMCCGAQTGIPEAGLLNLPIFPAPVVRHGIPLTKALGDVGVYVRNGYVLFGVELRLKNGQEPTVNIDLKPGSTLGDALRQIFKQVRGYTLEIASEHVINVYPTGAKLDPEDVLNLRIGRFDAVDLQPASILSRPQDFIPELKARLTPKQTGPPQPGGSIGPGLGVGGGGPTITLHMRESTVRQILNAVSEAMEQFPPNYQPTGWIYSFRPDSSSPIGGIHTWQFHWSVPHNWKEEAEKGKNPSH